MDGSGSTDVDRGAATASEARQLAREHAALRRIATLIAHQTPQAEVFTAVAEELGRVLGVEAVRMLRFDLSAEPVSVEVVGSAGEEPNSFQVGDRAPLGGNNLTTTIFETGAAARQDDYATASGEIGERVIRGGIRSAVGVPVTVEGRCWGVMLAAAIERGPLPPDAQSRLAEFGELMATAIAAAESREEIRRLAEEQAALRRVATLVAVQSPAADLLAKVAEEVAKMFGDAVESAILRFEPDRHATVVAVCGRQPPGGIRVGVRMPIDGDGVSARVYRERAPVRVDDHPATHGVIADHAHRHGLRAAVGCPVMVEGRPWGTMIVANYTGDQFPANCERRIAQFAELVATAIANAQARAEVERLAADQAALRRMATLVAQGAAPNAVFAAAIAEVQTLLEAAPVGLLRFDEPECASVLARNQEFTDVLGAATSVPLDGDSAISRVLATGRAARLETPAEGDGTISELARRHGIITSIAAPVTIQGEIWGAIAAAWGVGHPPSADAEARLAEFAELLDTAIANADSRDQLTASRARVLGAGDEARRRVVRDLHDGAQQRLVHTIVTLKLARQALDDDDEALPALIDEALDQARRGNEELRELAHGILPSVLIRGGLAAGVDALVARLDLLVEQDVTTRRLAPEIEASAYFVVAEALTNVVKHSRATSARVVASVVDGRLRLEVADDGKGGADEEGHGLLGLADRVEALGGQLAVESPPGGGTVVRAEIPVPAEIGR